jgi:hypothetical protein
VRRPLGNAEQGLDGSVLPGGMRVPDAPVRQVGFI